MKFVIALLLLAVVAVPAFAADQPIATDTQQPNLTLSVPTSGMVVAQADTAKPAEPATTDTPAGADSTTPEKKKPTVFALSLGLYSPTNGTVKRIFGSGYTRLGIRPLPTNAPHDWRFAFDVNFISMSSINGSATVIPLTAGVLRRFGKNNVKSYAALNVGPYYGSLSIPPLDINQHGFGLDANLTFGTVFNERYCVEARYDLMNQFAGYDFSSLSISVAVKMFTAKL